MLQGSIVLFNYEETHTLKGLVGVDALRGFLFVSQFNTCSILDRQIVHWTGLALVIYCSKHIFEEIQFPRCYHGRQGVWKRIRSKKLKLRLNICPIQNSDAQIEGSNVIRTPCDDRLATFIKYYILFGKMLGLLLPKQNILGGYVSYTI